MNPTETNFKTVRESQTNCRDKQRSRSAKALA